MGLASFVSRRSEIFHRIRTRWHLKSLQSALQNSGVETVYRVTPEGVSCLNEGIWFAYSFDDFGATGNIDYAGTLEGESRKFLYSVIGPEDVFYDIGAHGGLYSLTLKRRFPNMRVLSFEPLPDELRTNCRLNDIATDDIQPVAVGDTAGSAWITTSVRAANHLINGPSRDSMEVNVVRLDDYAELHALPPPDWIKVDVEGMELPVLRGAHRLLDLHGPVIICEINYLFDRFIPRLSELPAYMEALDYQLFRLQNGRLISVPNPCGTAHPSDLGASADNNFWFVRAGHRLLAGGAG